MWILYLVFCFILYILLKTYITGFIWITSKPKISAQFQYYLYLYLYLYLYVAMSKYFLCPEIYLHFCIWFLFYFCFLSFSFESYVCSLHGSLEILVRSSGYFFNGSSTPSFFIKWRVGICGKHIITTLHIPSWHCRIPPFTILCSILTYSHFSVHFSP